MHIEITIDDDGTEDSVVTAHIETPYGEISVMADVEISDRSIRLEGLHIGGGGANSFGSASLRDLVRSIMEQLDVDEIIVEGAVRTTGANPGRRPRPLRFTRAVRAASASRNEQP